MSIFTVSCSYKNKSYKTNPLCTFGAWEFEKKLLNIISTIINKINLKYAKTCTYHSNNKSINKIDCLSETFSFKKNTLLCQGQQVSSSWNSERKVFFLTKLFDLNILIKLLIYIHHHLQV